MFLAANPDRGKAAAEKEEIARKYKPGDSVFPKIVSGRREPDENGGRLLEEVRGLTVREQPRRSESPSRSRHTDRVGSGGRREDGRSRPREEDRTTRRQALQDAAQSAGDPQDPAGRTRRVEHQSSLRSLLSLSDAEVLEEEIIRQIMEEGLLDGIDLNNLGPTQEEELSERIADAYRRRHRLRSRSQQRREMRERGQQEPRSRPRAQSAQRPTAHSPQTSENQSSSRPQFLDPFASSSERSNHRRRSSDQGGRRRRPSPVRTNQASSSDDMLRPAARPGDMASQRSRTSAAGRRRPDELNTSMTRRATESGREISRISGEQGSAHNNGMPSTDSPTSTTSPHITAHHQSLPRSEQNPRGLGSPSDSTLVPAPLNPSSRSRPSSSRSNVAQPYSAFYVEPSVTCDRCGRPGIQYDLHKNCSSCNSGEYNLCMRCYRLGRGCLRWPGFGPSARAYFERVLDTSHSRPVSTSEEPHILRSVKYRRLTESAHRTMDDDKLMTNDDPALRRQTGFFCDICRSPANDCFWKCDQCNEGDWGFCNRCVNQGRCCTHTLLPICRVSRTEGSDEPTPRTTSAPSLEDESFKILSISTNCDICTYPIPASTTRFHCLECNHGDYDMCTNCYLKLVATGKISKENGNNGWRRCPRGHRMVVVGFEDHNEGQRRVIVRDLVGGRAVKDEHLQQQQQQRSTSAVPSPDVGSGDWSWKEGSERRKKASRVRIASSHGAGATSSPANNSPPESSPTSPHNNPSGGSSLFPRFPPDGGVGLVVHALWSWYPDDDVQDELTFPRGADITEAENINDDWFWGCYAGRTGLLPGAHVAVVGEVG